MQDFRCQCGETVRDERPKDCEAAECCGSKILAPGEIYDEPLPHSPVEREDGNRCKRCNSLVE